MFVENKYYKLYYTIISNAKSRVVDSSCYYEKHHIIPKSLGGTNSRENLVTLTPREHFICHRLLVKFTKGDEKRKMVFALMRLFRSKNSIHSKNITSSDYERLKVLLSNSLKRQWENPDYRENIIEKMKKSWTAERKQEFSKKIKSSWSDPAKRKEASDRSKNYYSNEINRDRLSEIQKTLHKENTDLGKKKSLPGRQNGMYGKTHTEEVKEKLSKLTKERLSNKSYEEIYGKEKAIRLKSDRSKKLKDYIQKNPNVRAGKNNANAKECVITSPSGEVTKTKSLKTFCKENNVSYGCLGAVARGARSDYNGWKVRYV